MIPSPSNPILFQIGPVNIGWYGVGYVIGVGVLLLIAQREARRRGYDPNHIWNALLLVGALALIGGRMYHVIDQWGACGLGEPCYSQNLARIFLPPYSGLGLYGGVAGAALGIVIYTRWKHLPLRVALDVVVPGALFAQGIARWGNYFNQELYGPPTNLPWGIQIDCAHRVAEWPCSLYPAATTGFQPLFFYESALDITGGLIALYISCALPAAAHPRRPGRVLGDLVRHRARPARVLQGRLELDRRRPAHRAMDRPRPRPGRCRWLRLQPPTGAPGL